MFVPFCSPGGRLSGEYVMAISRSLTSHDYQHFEETLHAYLSDSLLLQNPRAITRAILEDRKLLWLVISSLTEERNLALVSNVDVLSVVVSVFTILEASTNAISDQLLRYFFLTFLFAVDEIEDSNKSRKTSTLSNQLTSQLINSCAVLSTATTITPSTTEAIRSIARKLLLVSEYDKEVSHDMLDNTPGISTGYRRFKKILHEETGRMATVATDKPVAPTIALFEMKEHDKSHGLLDDPDFDDALKFIVLVSSTIDAEELAKTGQSLA